MFKDLEQNGVEMKEEITETVDITQTEAEIPMDDVKDELNDDSTELNGQTEMQKDNQVVSFYIYIQSSSYFNSFTTFN